MSDEASSARRLGSSLRQLRRDRGLTGQQLAELTGMSQPKISRIENGVGSAPTPDDVAKIARTLGADDDRTRQLVGDAQRLQPVAEWEVGDADLEIRQQGIGRLEQAATSIKIFQPTAVIGLLQTSGYAEAVLTAMSSLVAPGPGGAFAAASARIRRQKILDDPAKTFDLVMAEAVLDIRLCPAEEMPAQLRRIRELARRPNITVSIVPAGVRWPVPPVNGFTLLDDRHLWVDLYETVLVKQDQAEGKLYATVFDMMKRSAVQDIDGILDRYLDRYVRELAGGLA
jgi:transcriptional regulator with XRE-family HTH domain